MQTMVSIPEMRRCARGHREAGNRIGFVPTMGFLHEGHLQLVRRARALADITVVSIYVNPTQFGAGEDLDRYPRDLARDAALLEAEGADVLFTPVTGDLYPEGFSTYITVQGLSTVLEGAFRPTHFRGVTTIVAKLLNIVQPHIAVFGQKDAQQAIILRRMASDLDFDTDLVIEPTVREPDGLAMSSRNTYLSPSDRVEALAISRALGVARDLHHGGETRPETIRQAVEAEIGRSGALSLDYAAVVDAETLAAVDRIDPMKPVLVAVAARVGRTRLIDNIMLGTLNS